jgi:hypothetical protein
MLQRGIFFSDRMKEARGYRKTLVLKQQRFYLQTHAAL